MKFNNTEKLLVIHMDDIGMSYAANLAAIQLFKKGTVTSAGIMLPCAWAYDFIKWHIENPQYEVGVHLTHTCEWDSCRWRPFTDRREAPGLYDPEGFMWKGLDGELKVVPAEEYRKEIANQMKQALHWGMSPNHIDSHMSINTATPEFFRIFLEAADKYGLIPGIPEWALFNDDMKAEFNKFRFIQIGNGISSGDGICYASKKTSFYKELEKLKQGLNYIAIHPLLDMPEVRQIVPSWQERVWEYELFMEDETIMRINTLGIKPVTWEQAI